MHRIAICFLALAAFGQDIPNTWKPADLNSRLKSAPAPALIQIGFRQNYNGNHITHSVYAGPANTEQGLATLKKAVESLSKNVEIVIYCGCCPWENCPNIHPAWKTLKDAGFTNVRALEITTNLHEDWTAKGYPVEKGAIPKPD